MPIISVIVPVYQHWNIAFNLIDAIENQNLEKTQWELIMVDNGSDYIPTLSQLPDFVRLEHCKKPGSYAARNKGLSVAKGDLIVFTDADCRPEPTWLKQLLIAHKSGDAKELIAGAVRVSNFTNDTPNAFELYDMALGLPQEDYVKRGYAVTANLTVMRAVFEDIGNFDETRFSGGDGEFCRRAVKRGYLLSYEPTAVVDHPARSTWEELETKVRRVKGGQIRNGKFSRRFQYFVRSFLPPLRAYLKILRNNHLKAKHKIVVMKVQSKLWWVEMVEASALLFGRQPERR